MTAYQHPTALNLAVEALRKDLMREEGPQISTVRNYNFAILPYEPESEFVLRAAIYTLSEELRESGWTTGTVPLHSLMLALLRAQGSEFIDTMIRRELHLVSAADPWRGLRSLQKQIVSILEENDAFANDVIQEIHRILDEHPENPNRTVIFLGRAGALYPFLRTSALLKHVAGHTRNVPVVLLYPGKAIGETGLSFMGLLPADRDYRPRIYR